MSAAPRPAPRAPPWRRVPSSRQAAPFCRRLLAPPGRSSSPLRGCGRSTWTHSSTAGPTSLQPEGRKTIRRTPCPRPRLHRETSSSIAGARWWLHVAGTDRLTAYHLHRSRGRAAVNEFGVLPDYRGIAVHDALSVYDAYPDADHALCGAHLAWELTAAVE